MARGHSWWLWLLVAVGVYFWYQSTLATTATATPAGATGTPAGTTGASADTTTLLDDITARGSAFVSKMVAILPGPLHPWVSPDPAFGANVSPTLLDSMGNIVAFEPGGYIPVAVQQQEGMNSFLNPITPFSGPSGDPSGMFHLKIFDLRY